MSTRWTHKKVNRLLLEGIRQGWVEVIIDAEGVARYRITEEGIKHLDAVIADEKEE